MPASTSVEGKRWTQVAFTYRRVGKTITLNNQSMISAFRFFLHQRTIELYSFLQIVSVENAGGFGDWSDNLHIKRAVLDDNTAKINAQIPPTLPVALAPPQIGLFYIGCTLYKGTEHSARLLTFLVHMDHWKSLCVCVLFGLFACEYDSPISTLQPLWNVLMHALPTRTKLSTYSRSLMLIWLPQLTRAYHHIFLYSNDSISKEEVEEEWPYRARSP